MNLTCGPRRPPGSGQPGSDTSCDLTIQSQATDLKERCQLVGVQRPCSSSPRARRRGLGYLGGERCGVLRGGAVPADVALQTRRQSRECRQLRRCWSQCQRRGDLHTV